MTEALRFYRRQELLDTQRDWGDVMPHINKRIDDRLAAVPNLACKSGCAHCCKLKVAALPHDVVAVVEYVRYGDHFTREERNEIRDKLQKAVDMTKGMDEVEYRDANIPCPFLGDDLRCRVYEVRPVTCRSFGSTNADVCALTVPNNGETFSVVPDSLRRLVATSGLFFVPFLQGCLDWWQSKGLMAPVEPGVPEAVSDIQRALDRGQIKLARVNGSQP